jgi:predicted porin
MNKKLIALAVTSVFAAPAFAQAPAGVTLYGRANLGLDNYTASGATAGTGGDFKSRNRVFDSGSRLGVRGVEDLGGGLRAIFQIESGVNMDTGTGLGQGNQVNGSSGFLGSRPSWVGLEGGFGRLTFGRQDVWWGNGTISQTGANYVNTDIPFLTGAGGRVNAGIARQSNVMQYTTPTFGGFNTTLSYQPNSEAAAAGANTNARIAGITARWATGPISTQVDWSTLRSVSPLNAAAQNRPTNKNLKASLGFTYAPGAQISFLAEQLRNGDVGTVAGFSTAGDDVKQSFFAVTWEHRFGNVQALAQLGAGGKVSGCTETAGAVAGVSGSTCNESKTTAYMLGARYIASKRTAVYLTYNQVKNGRNATMDYTGGSITSANNNTLTTNAGLNGNTQGIPAGSAGADPRIIALGVQHNF